MIYQTLTLIVIGLFYALAAFENTPSNEELACSCKKKKKSSYMACEHHEEPLEEEEISRSRWG